MSTSSESSSDPMAADVPTPMTIEDLLSLPDDGTDRELIRGVLRERPAMVWTVAHGHLIGSIGHALMDWIDGRPEPRGVGLAGGACVRLRKDPDTAVGVDIAYLSADLASQTPMGARYVDGPPTLAVEVLSPSDTHGEVSEKIGAYLDAGVALVWIIDPVFKTIVVYRPDGPPRLFHTGDTIEGEPHLPGFREAMARIFAR